VVVKPRKTRKNHQTKKKYQTSQKQATKTYNSWQLTIKLKWKEMMIIWQRNQYLQTKGLFWGGKNLTQLYEEKTFNWDCKTVKYDKFEPSFLKKEKKKT
jgi:hypothetical protein